jgi:hypothetical protein
MEKYRKRMHIGMIFILGKGSLASSNPSCAQISQPKLGTSINNLVMTAFFLKHDDRGMNISSQHA